MVLAAVCMDEDSELDPDVAGSLSSSNEEILIMPNRSAR